MNGWSNNFSLLHPERLGVSAVSDWCNCFIYKWTSIITNN